MCVGGRGVAGRGRTGRKRVLRSPGQSRALRKGLAVLCPQSSFTLAGEKAPPSGPSSVGAQPVILTPTDTSAGTSVQSRNCTTPCGPCPSRIVIL